MARAAAGDAQGAGAPRRRRIADVHQQRPSSPDSWAGEGVEDGVRPRSGASDATFSSAAVATDVFGESDEEEVCHLSDARRCDE